MSFAMTNRVYLPAEVVKQQKLTSNRVYVSDDCAGDRRLGELYRRYGNLKMESCSKDSGKSLDELAAFWTGTIKEFFN